MAQDQVLDKIAVMYSEMTEVDQGTVLEIASNALRAQEKSERTLYHKDVAQMVKHDLDNQKGGTWNVICGRSYGSFVTHETKTMTHFMIGNIAFLIWRHG